MILHPEQWQKIKVLFEASLDKTSDLRSSFLDVACDDIEIKSEVRRLLANHAEMGGFLSEDAETVTASLGQNMPPRFRVGQLLANRFRIIRFIARGGMGEVYEAQDLELNARVAIKVIRPDLVNPVLLDRFKREVRIAKTVTHPDVCRVYDLFRHEGESEIPIYLISMELLGGQTLAQRLRTSNRLSPAEALSIIVEITAALESAHGVGVLHRDLKPENIMLVDRAEGQRVVVMDFGIARLVNVDVKNSEDTAAGGTPAYMSPEQRENRELTPASDIYSLGLLMYRMTTGTHASNRTGQLPFAPGFDANWENVILRCLEPIPSERYPSVRAVAEAIVRPAPLRRRLTMVASIVLFIGFIMAWCLFYSRNSHLPGTSLLNNVATIAVLGFSDQNVKKGDAWLSTILSSYLTEDLSTGGRLDLVSPDRIAEFKRDVGVDDALQIQGRFLSKAREVLATDYVLAGSYSVVDGTIHLDTFVTETRGGHRVAEHSERLPLAEVIRTAADSAAALRKQLGVPEPKPDELRQSRWSLPQTVDAMRLYADGLDKLRTLDALAARNLLEQAVAADSAFSLGHAALGDAWSMLGYANHSLAEAKKAFDSSGKLSWSSRLIVEARYREANSQWQLAADVYRQLWASNPSHFDYGLRVAEAEASGGRFQEARSALERIRAAGGSAAFDPRLDLMEARAAQETDHLLEEQAASRAFQKALQRGQRSLAASALREKGWALIRLNRGQEAVAVFRQARKIFEQEHDQVNAYRSLVNMVTALSGRAPNSERLLMDQEALAVFQTTGTVDAQAMASNNLAGILQESGDERKALELYNQAAILYQEVGDERRWAIAISNIGTVEQGLGHLDDAAQAYEKALAKFTELHNDSSRAGTLENLAEVLRTEGKLKEAEGACRDAHATRLRINKSPDGVPASACLADVLWEQGRLTEAGQLYERNLTDFKGRDPLGTIAALSSVSLVSLERGQLTLAQSYIDQAISKLTAIDKSELGFYELTKAKIDLEDNQTARAADFARRAVSRFQTRRWPDGEAEGRVVLSRALLFLGERDAARAELMRVQVLLPKIQSPKIRIVFLLQSVCAALASNDKSALAQAKRDVELALNLARTHGMFGYQLKAEFETARVQLQMGKEAAAMAEFKEVARLARLRGFTLLATKALEMISSRAAETAASSKPG
jgi:serine/threonine protein kinase/tetratricopeptide (TPR) repeat protein